MSDVRTKIKSLLSKTVANGATSAEQESARQIARRLIDKHELHAEFRFAKPPAKPQPTSDAANHLIKTTAENVEMFFNYRDRGILKKHAGDIDWDRVAKELLDEFTYMDYVHATHSLWERRAMTTLNLTTKAGSFLRLTLEEYRIECFKRFISLYKESTK